MHFLVDNIIWWIFLEMYLSSICLSEKGMMSKHARMLETIVMNSGITQKANQKNGLNLKDYFHFFAISFSLIWQKMKKRSKPKYRVFRQVPESITTRNRKSNKLNYLHIGLLSIDVSRFLSRCSSRQ